MPLKSSEELQGYGKQAAHAWAGGEHPTLTQAVVGSVKTAGLNREQVQRVVEATNKEAHAIMHNKEGSADRVVTFDGGLARADEALRHLNSTPEPIFYGSLADYQDAPKQASAELPPAPELPPLEDPLLEVRKLAARYDSLLKQADSQLSNLETEVEWAGYSLLEAVKTANAGGSTLGEIVQAWGAAGADPYFVKRAFEEITPGLVKTGRWKETGMAEDLRKVAAVGLYADTSHPVVKAFIDFSSSVAEKIATEKVAQDLHENLAAVRSFLQNPTEETFQKVAQTPAIKGEDVKGLVSKGMDLWGKGADLAGKGAHWAASHLADKGSKAPEYAATAARGVVKGVPVVGAGLLGLKALNHIQAAGQSPVGQFVKSWIPGTQAYEQDKYDTQVAYGAIPSGYGGGGYGY